MIKRLNIFILGIILFSSCPVAAADISVKGAVEKTEVYVGEPFIFQIQVSGTENPEQPDTSGIKDFTVVFQGGQQNSSSSITIINGKVTRDVREGYYFNYQLTPLRSGSLIIPSIRVTEGKNFAETQPVRINASEPSETEDFKLRLSLSKGRCYVGEPVTLAVTWYIGKDVRDFNFTLPVMSDPSFKFADPEVSSQAAGNLYRIPLGNSEATGVKARGTLEGREYTTITFNKVLIPLRSGDITIDPATVSCSALTGYQRQRDRFNDRFFDNFFNDDFFGSSRTGVYNTVVVPSNSLTLKVLDLPQKGRPADFAGHVGKYIISADATPLDVSVGDPITLTLTLSGPEYLDNVQMPALDRQPSLSKDFKIPQEQAAGVVSGSAKVFTQTIRPLNSDIKEIPPIELPYFNTETETYQTARTDPIPLTVKETRFVTALDAEGNTGETIVGSEVETFDKGIAFNYDDASVIENATSEPLSWFRSPLGAILILGPPFIYIILSTGSWFYRHRTGDQSKARSRKAYGRILSSLKEARRQTSVRQGCTMVQEALRNYLGDKFDMPGNALTFKDIKDRLSKRSVDANTINGLEDLFRRCEEGCYAGNADIGDMASITDRAAILAKGIEKRWRRA